MNCKIVFNTSMTWQIAEGPDRHFQKTCAFGLGDPCEIAVTQPERKRQMSQSLVHLTESPGGPCAGQRLPELSFSLHCRGQDHSPREGN